MARLLVVDDERSMREMLEILLGREGHEVDLAADAKKALELFEEHRHALVLTDVMLGRQSGFDVLKSVKQKNPSSEVIVMTAYSTTEVAIQAMKLGAYDYGSKPFKVDELQILVQKALEKSSLREDNAALREQLAGRDKLGEIIGHSAAMKSVFALIEKAAPTKAALTAILPLFKAGASRYGVVNLGDLTKLSAFLVKNKLLKSPVPASQAATNEFLPKG